MEIRKRIYTNTLIWIKHLIKQSVGKGLSPSGDTDAAIEAKRNRSNTEVYYNNIKPLLKWLGPASTLTKLKSHLSGHFLSRSHVYIRQRSQLYSFPCENDCCCIYKRPAINASSGKLVITNGSRNTKVPFEKLETLTRGVLSWRDWSAHFVYLFI